MSVISEFYSGLLDKGYTEREIRESCKRHQERVAPDWFNGTYQEYIESIYSAYVPLNQSGATRCW